jgi:hypothetical protein
MKVNKLNESDWVNEILCVCVCARRRPPLGEASQLSELMDWRWRRPKNSHQLSGIYTHGVSLRKRTRLVQLNPSIYRESWWTYNDCKYEIISNKYTYSQVVMLLEETECYKIFCAVSLMLTEWESGNWKNCYFRMCNPEIWKILCNLI